MAVTKIYNRVNLDSDWSAVSTTKSAFYLIAIKDKSAKSDTIDVDSINKVRFEIGIDSGITNKPLTIHYIVLDFASSTSSDNELNKITAYTKVTGLPKQFYIKPVSFGTSKGDVKIGVSSISVNMNEFDV